MTAPSARDSKTHRQYRKIPLQEKSLSSQESTNRAVFLENSHADPYGVPNCSKTRKRKIQCHTPSSIAVEPAANPVQDEITPLSGNPYFTCVLQKSHVQHPFRMLIPKHFCPLLPYASVPVVLSYRNKNWKMIYYGDHSFKQFNPVWREFVIDNNLKAGDGCVFELTNSKHLEFRVQILSGQIPPVIANAGRSSDMPIVID